MRFWWNNLIDASGVTITESSEVATLPSSNVTHEFKTKVWRTGTSVAAEYVTFDLGSAQAVTSIIVLAHTLLNTDSSIQIVANSSDTWGTPAFTQNLTWAANLISQTFTSQSYRYWRFRFTKASAGVSRDVGRIFLGTYSDTTDNPDWDGLQVDPQDLSTKQRSIGGQQFVDDRSKFRLVKCEFSGISTTDVTTIKTFCDTVGTAKSFFSQPLTTGDGESDEIFYVKFRKVPERDTDGIHSDGTLAWSSTLEMEEQL